MASAAVNSGEKLLVANRRLAVLLPLLIICSAVLVMGRPAKAADSSPPQGITISPAFQQVSIDSSQASQPVSFSITNNKPTTQNLTLSSADFNTLSETGGLVFVGSKPTDIQKKYGLAEWFDLPQKSLSIQPKQTIKVSADILNLASMPAGGHYGALLVSLSNGSQSGQNGNVSIHPIASSLLFVTKIGGDTHKLSLANVYVKHSLLRLPGSVTLRFHDDGNTHLIPRGSVTLYDSGHRLISKGIINQDSGIILPAAYRRYSVQLQRVNIPHLPGRYTLNVDFRFDGISQYRRYSASFFSIPRLVAGAEIIIAVALIAGAVLLAVRNYRSYKK